MLEERSIEVWAYNLETILAEKLQTVISRGITNTRMRDYYDLYILYQLHGETLSHGDLKRALGATAKRRGSVELISDARQVFDTIENSLVLQRLWEGYQKKFSYAEGIMWSDVLKCIEQLYVLVFH